MPNARLSAAGRSLNAGLWLRFAEGAALQIDSSALFANVHGEGLKVSNQRRRHTKAQIHSALSVYIMIPRSNKWVTMSGMGVVAGTTLISKASVAVAADGGGAGKPQRWDNNSWPLSLRG